MTLHIIVPKQSHTDFTPRITVVGVGGGGTNAVDNMIALNLQGVDFVVANTDAQQLQHSRADRRVQLGPHLTQGLGAGAKPEIGRAAAEEAADELMHCLDGTHMVFITAGMGGGTGTGAAPVIARMARERGILTVGVVTKPFTFEGGRRTKSAEAGITELQQYVDTLIVIPNQNLFRLANERTGWKEAFKMADNVLYMGVRGVTDLMMAPGLVNLDFADIRTVMAEMGKAMMGTGEAEGENRATRAAEAAISNPLLEDTSMAGARGLLINITGGEDMTLFEVDQAANRVRQEVADDANIIFGSAVDESLAGKVRVSVVATGIDMGVNAEAKRPQLVAVGNGGMIQAVSSGFVPQMGGGQAAAPPPPAETRFTPTPMLVPRPTAPEPAPAHEPMAQEAPAPGRAESFRATPHPAPTVRPVAPAEAYAAPAASPPSYRPSLFEKMTRSMRRPAEPEPTEPQRAEPSFSPDAAPAAPASHYNGSDEALDIPAFLRRQSSGRD
ncbi:MAG: cell division protein FtsZ [Acetobacteraceae bacterium]|nr:cell division protein FtsZ [Acetobacteraceae bacterium]